jgi:hypothetical protein
VNCLLRQPWSAAVGHTAEIVGASIQTLERPHQAQWCAATCARQTAGKCLVYTAAGAAAAECCSYRLMATGNPAAARFNSQPITYAQARSQHLQYHPRSRSGHLLGQEVGWLKRPSGKVRGMTVPQRLQVKWSSVMRGRMWLMRTTVPRTVASLPAAQQGGVWYTGGLVP